MTEFIKEFFLHIIPHTFKDTITILPFLFLTYLFMEYIEHASSGKIISLVKKSGKIGPLIGSLAGIVPQCGFSATASSLYSGRVITLGTLFAVFLSTSDEMLPIMITHKAPIVHILIILSTKLILGIVVGFVIDFIFRTRKTSNEICVEEICDKEHCQCKKGIFRSALHHSISVFAFIFLVTLILNTAIHSIGEQTLADLIISKPVIGQILCAAVGLIPNCASSVVITELFLQNIITSGAMMSGVLVGAGVGILILFRTNRNIKENIKITAALYVI